VAVYTDGLTGDDLANFMAGWRAWGCKICVGFVFRPGDAPSGAANAIQINVVDPGDPSLGGKPGMTSMESYTADGATQGTLTGGSVAIASDVLGDASAMQNLGTHEAGHVFGLDDLSEVGERTDAMNPEFDQLSPYLKPSQAHQTALSSKYDMTCPEPSAALYVGIPLILLAVRRRGRTA
jgi:hypothetical protein